MQDVDGLPEPETRVATPAPAIVEPALDNTTLLNNEEESFALAPVDATVLKGSIFCLLTVK